MAIVYHRFSGVSILISKYFHFFITLLKYYFGRSIVFLLGILYRSVVYLFNMYRHRAQDTRTGRRLSDDAEGAGGGHTVGEDIPFLVEKIPRKNKKHNYERKVLDKCFCFIYNSLRNKKRKGECI